MENNSLIVEEEKHIKRAKIFNQIQNLIKTKRVMVYVHLKKILSLHHLVHFRKATVD
jgi:hypothetical protein